jgi:hypothetical protein
MNTNEDFSDERYETLKRAWRAVMKDGREDVVIHPHPDEDLAFAAMVDDMGGLDAAEDYIKGCLHFIGEGDPSTEH